MTDAPDLRTFATFDGHGGKVSQRVEVLDHRDDDHEGLVAVLGAHPLGAVDERPLDDDASLARGVASIGWVDPATLRDWYRPDRVVVPDIEARRSDLSPGTYADTRGRGRVRIDSQEAHLGPDGRPAFRALAGSGVVDVPLPKDQVVRLVTVRADVPTESGAAGTEIVTTPISPLLAPGEYPSYADDVPGLPRRASSGRVHVRAAVLLDGTLFPVERLDEPANTIWIRRDDRSVPIAANEVGPDLVRYTASPV
ncbi:hypothetical protein DEJ13_02990 [Curtobacterium sp. MCLR17_007]|uniref:hypothetical protein n=1 Tax=Curtobacterium sp. MCLR17_007 TaxID=2175648 RepID=UPI000DAA0580|nr:hypothetical protein [Curtobacterium sp. MCLR17_007]WIB60813.1 hypothetical protein DEJ13_02990 [Curtobacterium sp. MCLR17_007]